MAGKDFSNLTEQEKLDLYRKEISCYASKGKIPSLAQFRLDLLREDLGISAEVAQAIETEVFIPFFEYQKNLALFKEAVLKEIDNEFHISKESHQELEKLRLQIGIKLEDASRFFAESCIERPSIISPLIIKFRKFKNLAVNFQSFLTAKLETWVARILSFTRNEQFPKTSLIISAIAFSILLGIPAMARIIQSSPVAEPPLQIEVTSSTPKITEPPLPAIEPVLNTILLINSLEASDNLISSISTNTQNTKIAFASYKSLSWFFGKENTVRFFQEVNYTDSSSSKLGIHQGWMNSKLGIHQGWINSVAFSPNGRLLGSASDDKSIKIWDIVNRMEISTFTNEEQGRVKSLLFSSDGSLLVSSSSDKKIRFWSVSEERLLKTLDDTHSGSLAFSPDNLLIASGSDDGTINIFNVPSMQQSTPTFTSIPYHRFLKHSLIGHTQGVKAIAFSPNGKLIASGGFDDKVKVWDVQTGREIRSFSGHTNDVNSVLFSADSKSVISGSNDGTIKIWNIDDGSVSTTQTGKKVTAIAFGQDKYKNEIIISAGMGDISIWKPQYIAPNA